MISLFHTDSYHITDTPVKLLCSIDPSLNDDPATSITHVTVDSDWRSAAVGFDCVETSGFGARTEDLRTVWHTHTHKYTVWISNIRRKTWYFKLSNVVFPVSRLWPWPACSVSWVWLDTTLFAGWLNSCKLRRRASCFWTCSFRSFSFSRRRTTCSLQMSDAYTHIWDDIYFWGS